MDAAENEQPSSLPGSAGARARPACARCRRCSSAGRSMRATKSRLPSSGCPGGCTGCVRTGLGRRALLPACIEGAACPPEVCACQGCLEGASFQHVQLHRLDAYLHCRGGRLLMFPWQVFLHRRRACSHASASSASTATHPWSKTATPASANHLHPEAPWPRGPGLQAFYKRPCTPRWSCSGLAQHDNVRLQQSMLPA